MALENLAETLATWAAGTPSVSGLTLFGSRARNPSDPLAAPDARSDWDFQVISSDPGMFSGRAWAESLGGATLRVYAPRMTRLGGVPKVNVLFDGAEADFVIIPTRTLRAARVLVALGLHRREGFLRRGLRDLAVVIRPGWRFLKGAGQWEGSTGRSSPRWTNPGSATLTPWHSRTSLCATMSGRFERSSAAS